MIKVLGSVLGIALVSVGLFINANDSMHASRDEGYKVGDIATNFSLKNIDNKFVSLNDYKNEDGVIVIFTCNSCPYANMYEERIIALHENFKSKGYPVVAIMPNDVQKKPEDAFDQMQLRAEQRSYQFPYLIDETQEIARRFGATKTPHVFLLNNKNDQYKVSFIGAIDDNVRNENKVKVKYVEKAIAELKSGNPVSKSTAIAVGCTIKWKDNK